MSNTVAFAFAIRFLMLIISDSMNLRFILPQIILCGNNCAFVATLKFIVRRFLVINCNCCYECLKNNSLRDILLSISYSTSVLHLPFM